MKKINDPVAPIDPIAKAAAKAASLACWSGPVDPQPLAGGLTNLNFVIEDRSERFVVRVADDIPIHGIMRFNELAASRAAYEAGVSPEVVHAEPGALVLRFIDGETFGEAEVRQANDEGRILPLLRRVHDDMPKYFRGPLLAFWVFQSMRGYGIALRDGNSRMMGELPHFTTINDELEAAVGSIRLVFGHNDLLAANFMDDGERLWLIDWDYAGPQDQHGLEAAALDVRGIDPPNGLAPSAEGKITGDGRPREVQGGEGGAANIDAAGNLAQGKFGGAFEAGIHHLNVLSNGQGLTVEPSGKR